MRSPTAKEIAGLPTVEVERHVRHLMRQHRETRKHLKELTTIVGKAIAALDAEMKKPSGNQRGQRIAKITNAVEWVNDCAIRYGLNIPNTEITGSVRGKDNDAKR